MAEDNNPEVSLCPLPPCSQMSRNHAWQGCSLDGIVTFTSSGSGARTMDKIWKVQWHVDCSITGTDESTWRCSECELSVFYIILGDFECAKCMQRGACQK